MIREKYCWYTARPSALTPIFIATCIVSFFFFWVQQAAAETKSELLTIDRIFQDEELEIEEHAPITWTQDGAHFITVQGSTAILGGSDIVQHNPLSGEETVIVDAKRLTPKGGKPLRVKNYSFSDNGEFVLVHTNTVAFRRREPLGDYWLLNIKTGALRQLKADARPSSLMYAKFSPNSDYVAYLHQNNIYIESVDGDLVKQLTTDGSDIIVNGTGDWVNEEEFSIRDGFKWSPDSTRIAYWQFDTEGVGTFHMIKNTDVTYPEVISIQYPKVGTQNSATRIGVVNVQSAETSWMALKGDPRENYVPRMDWADDSSELVIQYMNRLQNRNRVILADARSGAARVIHTEKDKAWLDPNDDLTWLSDGTCFTWLSERDGWRRLYRISRDGKEKVAITPKGADVLSIIHIDVTQGWAYYIASPEDPAGRYLYRSALFGKMTTERLTPQGVGAHHDYNISPGSTWAVHTVSRIDSPPIVSIISLPDHEKIRTLIDNASVATALRETPRGTIEFFEIDIAKSTTLDGWMMTPPNFDRNKQYPVLFHVYGEPWTQTVSQRWRREQFLWHQFMTQQGYVIVSVDNRGTPAPKGRDWRKVIYGAVGFLAAKEQAEAVKALLAQRPYLDAERVGIWGWSGGGSMTLHAMFRYPDIYSAGVSIAPVPNQRLYDTIYQERYMGLPDENSAGYKKASPINYVNGLEGELMLIHGTADDNVHYQGVEQLIDKMVELNKPFSIMIYPDGMHGLKEKPNMKRHVFGTMTKFFLENIPPETSTAP